MTIHGSSCGMTVAISVLIGQKNYCGLDPLGLGKIHKTKFGGLIYVQAEWEHSSTSPGGRSSMLYDLMLWVMGNFEGLSWFMTSSNA